MQRLPLGLAATRQSLSRRRPKSNNNTDYTMTSSSLARSLPPLFVFLAVCSTSQASWLSDISRVHAINAKAAKDIGKLNRVQSAAKTTIKETTDVKVVKDTAAAAIDQTTREAQVAVEDRRKVELDKAHLEVKEKLFSAGVIGLFISNTFTLVGLVNGRKRTALELKKLELEISEKELAIERLRKGEPPVAPQRA